MIACFDMGGATGGSRGEKAGKRGGESASKPAMKPAAVPAPAGACDLGNDPNRRESGATVQGPVPTGGPVRVASDGASRYASGAPSIVSVDAPPPDQHPAGRSDEEIRALFAAKSRQRESAIGRLIEESKAKGESLERFVAAITYDCELAPRTTNRRQLLELGIEVPTPDSLPTDQEQIRRALWTIIYGLARLGIFLTGTDALDDRALLERLCGSVLLDEVADIPPTADMSEFIDLSACGADGTEDPAPDVDGLVGPLDFDSDDDGMEDLGLFRASPNAQGGRPAHGRDRLLPRPDRT
ncbi:MAG: hypothetical protein RLZZ238_2535 [Planctomycetota bacterium]